MNKVTFSKRKENISAIKQGQICQCDDGDFYIAIRPGHSDTLLLVSLHDGNRWSNNKEDIFDGNKDKFTLFKGTITIEVE